MTGVARPIPPALTGGMTAHRVAPPCRAVRSQLVYSLSGGSPSTPFVYSPAGLRPIRYFVPICFVYGIHPYVLPFFRGVCRRRDHSETGSIPRDGSTITGVLRHVFRKMRQVCRKPFYPVYPHYISSGPGGTSGCHQQPDSARRRTPTFRRGQTFRRRDYRLHQCIWTGFYRPMLRRPMGRTGGAR